MGSIGHLHLWQRLCPSLSFGTLQINECDSGPVTGDNDHRPFYFQTKRFSCLSSHCNKAPQISRSHYPMLKCDLAIFSDHVARPTTAIIHDPSPVRSFSPDPRRYRHPDPTRICPSSPRNKGSLRRTSDPCRALVLREGGQLCTTHSPVSLLHKH
jgi:hypothetical protein